MRNENVFTLPILNQNQELEGLITTNDITESYMDVYNNAALSEARTPYRNILETVDGTMIVGNEHAHFTDGKVLIAASSPEVMEQSVEQNDLVILETVMKLSFVRSRWGKLYHCLYGCSDFEDDPPTGRGERMFCDQFSA